VKTSILGSKMPIRASLTDAWETQEIGFAKQSGEPRGVFVDCYDAVRQMRRGVSASATPNAAGPPIVEGIT
jgi:hypothetical protein